MKELEANPEFRKKAQEKEERRLLEERQLRAAEEPLLEDLRRIGLDLESVWDLVNGRSEYGAALSVLADHLVVDYPKPIRDGLARSLAVPEAQFAWDVLKEEYLAEPEGRAKQGLAVALAGASGTSTELLRRLVEIAREPEHGESRLLLLVAIARLPRDEARPVLLELSKEKALRTEARSLLRRI